MLKNRVKRNSKDIEKLRKEAIRLVMMLNEKQLQKALHSFKEDSYTK